MIFSEEVKNTILEDIKEFQMFNKFEESPNPIIWDSFKAFFTGQANFNSVLQKERKRQIQKRHIRENC